MKLSMPNGIIALLALCIFIFAVAGCSSIGKVIDGVTSDSNAPKLAVQYAVIKIIKKSDDITSEKVISHVDRVRGIVSGNAILSLANLIDEVRGQIDWQALKPEDRLLLDALIAEIQYAIEDVGSGSDSSLISDQRRVRILTLLDWVEQAASYAN